MQSDEETDEQSYIVKNLIEQSKVGSHIFVDTEIYLKLLVNQPCIKCGSIELIKKAHKASTHGFILNVIVHCKICGKKTKFNNSNQ